MSQNRAAYLAGKQVKPLVVRDAPYPKPAANEVVIKQAAAAVNPVDWKIQDTGLFLEDKNYPFILGTDAAGEITEVGSDVKAFKKGDRVMGHTNGLFSKDAKSNGFQLYTTTPARLTCKIPSSMSFTTAVVLPLAIDTAASGLFQKDHLGLPLPTKTNKPTGKTVLIWGGSSSVGLCAIQLAVAAGVEVATTASKRNHDLLKSLGAKHVFDYNESSVDDKIASALKGSDFAGVYDAISLADTITRSAQIASKVGGHKFVATTLPPPEKGLPADVKCSGVFALTVDFQFPDIGDAIWTDYIPQALESGAFKALPEPQVVGKGLEKVQAGLDAQKAGVSAKKIVVEL